MNSTAQKGKKTTTAALGKKGAAADTNSVRLNHDSFFDPARRERSARVIGR